MKGWRRSRWGIASEADDSVTRVRSAWLERWPLAGTAAMRTVALPRGPADAAFEWAVQQSDAVFQAHASI